MRRRGKLLRRDKPQAAPVGASPGPLSTGSPRRGLVSRTTGALARRRVLRTLTTPAAAGLVAVAVVAIFAALAVGALLGAALATRGAGEEL